MLFDREAELESLINDVCKIDSETIIVIVAQTVMCGTCTPDVIDIFNQIIQQSNAPVLVIGASSEELTNLGLNLSSAQSSGTNSDNNLVFCSVPNETLEDYGLVRANDYVVIYMDEVVHYWSELESFDNYPVLQDVLDLVD